VTRNAFPKWGCTVRVNAAGNGRARFVRRVACIAKKGVHGFSGFFAPGVVPVVWPDKRKIFFINWVP